MAPTLRNTPESYRSGILHEFQIGRSIEEAYKNFRENTKNYNFYYVEFAYWFNRFANEKFDLDDESFDKKPLTFSDLPNEILGEIVEKLDMVSRLQTRKVSRRLRSVVDKRKAYYENIFISTKKNRVDIIFDEIVVHYGKLGCLGHKGAKSSKHKYIKDENFIEIALNDLAIALKKPTFQLKCLELVFVIDAVAETAKILNFLESLKAPIHVKSLRIRNSGSCDILPILSLLESGTLEKFEPGGVNKGLNVNELVKMDQWKEAKEVSIGNIPVRFEDFLHFNSFDINVNSISAHDVLILQSVLSKSTNFKKCRLEIFDNHNRMNLDEIAVALGSTVDVNSYCLPRINHRHRIPGTNEFLEFQIFTLILYIKRAH